MRLFRFLFMALCAALVLNSLSLHPVQAQNAPQAAYVPGEVLIGWAPDGSIIPSGRRSETLTEDRSAPEWQAAAAKLASATGLRVVAAQPEYGTAVLAVPAGSEMAEVDRLRRLPWVAYAEPNYLALAAGGAGAAPIYPTDPSFGEQWNMRRIAAPAAWGLTLGSSTITVALVDSGVDRGHPEFAGRLLPGWDYVNNDSDPSDDYGHGTHVAGILAAAMNNGLGVAGLAPQVKLLPLKVLDSSGGGSYANIASAIRRAADAGAQIINVSLGGSAWSQDMLDAVNYAQARQPVGVLVVAAIGNCAQGGSACSGANPDFYPAGYPGVLAVASSDHFDRWATYSNYKSYVGIAAPGGVSADQILSTLPGSAYGTKYGTSMATPLVSAAAALVWTLKPAASYSEVAGILKDTADEVGSNPLTGQPLSYTGGRNNYFGDGRLNVGKAVRWAYPPALMRVADPQVFLLGDATIARTRQLVLENPSGQSVWWQASIMQGAGWLSLNPGAGTANYSAPGILGLRVERGALPPGDYLGSVRVQPLLPVGLASFDIPVELRIRDGLHRTYVPDIRSTSLGDGWRDPFGAGAFNRERLNLTNDTSLQLSLPFRVTFYGGNFSSLWVSDNGLVTFGSAPPGAAPTDCPPAATEPNNALYVLAADWRPDLGGQVVAHSADADTYVITWSAMLRSGSAVPATFQLVLRRAGVLTANYRIADLPAQSIVAAENGDGTVAQSVWCNGAGRAVGAGDVVVFNPVLPW